MFCVRGQRSDKEVGGSESSREAILIHPVQVKSEWENEIQLLILN